MRGFSLTNHQLESEVSTSLLTTDQNRRELVFKYLKSMQPPQVRIQIICIQIVGKRTYRYECIHKVLISYFFYSPALLLEFTCTVCWEQARFLWRGS